MPTDLFSEKIAQIEKRLEKVERSVAGNRAAVKGQKRLLTRDEAAAFLGLTPDGLHGLTHRKLIPYYKPNGKNIYFDVNELVAWQKKHHFEPLGDKVEDAEDN